MKAIVAIDGNQYQVEEGRYVQVHHLDAQPEDELTFDNVVLVGGGEHVLVGSPFVEGAVVKAKVRRHYRDKKVIIYKMRCKKGYRKKTGHRQGYTEIQILDVQFPNKEKLVSLFPKPAVDDKPKRQRPEKASTPAAPAKPAAKPKAEAKAATPKAEAKPIEAAVVETTPVDTEVAEKPKAAAKPKAPKAEGEAGEKKAPAKKSTTPKASTAKKADGEAAPKKKATKPKAEADEAPSGDE